VSRRRKAPKWLSASFAIFANQEVVAHSGGIAGVRDLGLLESALARGAQRWACDEGADLCDAAAAVCHGVCKNHPFLDGNKRTAFQCAYVTLRTNGLQLMADELEVVMEMEMLADGRRSAGDFAAFLRVNTRKRSR
jgi:death-on-curing protein